MKGSSTVEASKSHRQPGDQPALIDLNDDEPFLPETPPNGRRASHFLLFFALLPPAETRHQMWALAQRLRRHHGLEKEAMAVDRLHLTLQLVVGFEQNMPRLIVRSAIRLLQAWWRLARPCPSS
jgi:hypothetical protein